MGRLCNPRALLSERGKQKRQRSDDESRGQNNMIAGFKGEKGPWYDKSGQTDEKTNEFLPKPPEKNAHLQTPWFNSLRPIQTSDL